MAYPPATLDTTLLNETDAETGVDDAEGFIEEGGTPGEGDHAERHNLAAAGVNDIVAELGANPSGGEATVQARLEALGLTLASKADTTAVSEALAAKASKAELAAEEAARISGLAGKASTAEVAAVTKAREEGELAAREVIAREGMPEKWWPALAGWRLWKPQTNVVIAASTHLLRWSPPRNMTLRGISFVVVTAATNNDECAVALKAEDGKTILAKSVATAGKLNASPARQDIDFTADVAVTGGKTYYLGFQYNTVGGTAASLLNAEFQQGNSVGGMFGTSPPNSWVGSTTVTFPFATETNYTTAATRVYMIARER